ncbi:uncharacterized protein LOC126825500 [Patella vulgata]|uniref:uncharacterized protein LOC126825500 n=1 Tax=Patella vulgata TaxID=6465 RepID=UPI00217F94D4|nr:uncharacterized protein LOC126825500 [Patella vulgata]
MGENEVELTFSQSSEGRRRSVRFNNDDNIIPNRAGGNSSGLLAPGTHGSLKPVSEHVLTPVPSPLPPEFFRKDSATIEPVRQDVSAVETLLLRLLDDLNNARLSREDLEMLATYCFGILKDHDEDDTGELEGFEIQKDLKKTSSCRVANELIQFTLHKLLKDIKSGAIQDGDLTAITKSLVSQRQQRSGNPLDDDIYDHVMDTLERVGVELGGKEDSVNDNLGADDFISDTLCQVVDDIKSKKLSEADLIKIGSNAIAASKDESTGIRASEFKPSLVKLLQDLNEKKLKVDSTLSAIISSYYIVSKLNREAIKDFVKEIYPKLVLGLNQVNDANLKTKLTTLAADIEGDKLAELEVQEVGKVILDAGKKYLAQRQTTNETKSSPSKDAPIGFKDLTSGIRKNVNKIDFRKVVFKALAEYFVSSEKPRSNSKSGYRSIHMPASSQSKLAVNIILTTMDRITRDVYTNQIPTVILTSIATFLFHLAKKHPTIHDLDQQFPETKPMDVLEHMLHQSKQNKITYRDTKRIFASIFHSYVDPIVDDKVPEFQEIDHKNTLLIGELIDETINHIVRTVAIEIKEKLPGEQIAVIEIEDLVREELHGLGDSSGRSPEIKHIEGDLNELVMECLSKAACDIANYVEGVDSEASFASCTKIDEACFSSRVVDFILSVIDHLIKNFKNGDITSASVCEFLTYVLKTSHVGMTDDHLNERLNLLKTDIEQRRDDSSFFSSVAVLFSQLTLNPRSTSPELCILSKILSSIDANVLLEFVQAAMLSVLTYINEAPREQLELPIDDENSLFRVESFILVRRVISYVINKITDDVKSQAMKTSGSKSLFKRSSFKKVDNAPEHDMKLRECVLDKLNETIINLKSELGVDDGNIDQHKLSPMTSIDNNILIQMEKITQMIKCRAAGGPCATSTKDDLFAIADVMKEVTEDMTEALGNVSNLNLATNIFLTDLTSDNVEQLVLQTIHDALTSMQAEDVAHLDKTMSLSIVSSKSSHLLVEMFTEVLSRTVDNVKQNRIGRENLTALAEDLAEKVGPCPKSSFDSMDETMLTDFVVECLSEFKERVEAGKLDKNVMEEVTRRMALMHIDKSKSSSSLCSVSSMTVDIMVTNVLSSIITETGKAQALTQVEHMAIPSGKSLNEAESLNEVILKPIVGTKPLNVGEDLISPALSAITMKTRASHHNPPETEPRQSYRSLICPDIRDKTAKGAITAIVGSDKMGSGAVVNLNELEELSGEETCASDTESQTFIITELTGSQASAGPAAGKSSKTHKSAEAVTKTSSSDAKPKSSTTGKSSTTVKSKSKTSSSSVTSKHRKSQTTHKESMEELVHVHDVLTDPKSTESQSQVGATQVKSVCGSHRSAIVVREQEENVDSR